jgi:hypothetical protein
VARDLSQLRPIVSHRPDVEVPAPIRLKGD